MERTLGCSERGLREAIVHLQRWYPAHKAQVLLFFPSQSKQSSSYSDRDTTEEESESLDDMDFLTRQKKLQAEAKMALAMAKPMAKMQVEVEKQNRKKSPVADLVSSERWNTTKWGLACRGWLASVGCKWLRLSQSFPRVMQTWVSRRHCVKRHWEIFKSVSFSFLLYHRRMHKLQVSQT